MKKGPIYMIAASVCWSFGGLCIKNIPWSGISIIGMRALLAAAVFAVYRRSVKVSFTRGNVMSALCLSGTLNLFVFANQMTTAAAAILLQFTAPVFIILIHLVFYGKKPKLTETAAVSVTVLGMALFFLDGPEVTEYASNPFLGNILAILSGLTFAGVFVCNKRVDTEPNTALFLGFLINAAIGMPFVFFDGNITADPVAWGSAVFLGAVQVGLAYIFFSSGIRRTPALLACLITALEPVLNPVWVSFTTNEIPGFYTVAGGMMIITAVVFYNVWTKKITASDSSADERNNNA